MDYVTGFLVSIYIRRSSVQAEVGLTDRVEEIICNECGQSIIVEYIDDEMRMIECPCCGALINVLWSW
jgi:hypothetical protein